MRKTVLAVLCLGLLALPVAGIDAAGTPGNVVISEIYGGGGNSEATYANDYVELFNRTRSDIDVTNWTVGYSSAAGSTWTSLTLRGTIPAYHYMLIRYGTAGGGGGALPVTPDATASTNIARTAGKIRLTNANGVVDLVGYGTKANAYETRPTPAPADNKLSITRQPSACSDTNDNATDMKLKTPTPKNRASHGYACGKSPVLAPIGNKSVAAGSSLTFTVSATDADRDPLTYSASPLPPGATFSSSTRTFSWTPTSSNIGVHNVTFTVSDGFRKDSETIAITVKESTSGGTSSITANIGLSGRRMQVDGNVAPNHAGHEVVVRLFRYESDGFRRIAAIRDELDAGSAYSVTFTRPAPGRCLVKAAFYGDTDHTGSIKKVETPC